MTNMDISFISLVKKGANKQKIQIYKSDDYQEPGNDSVDDDVKGFFNVVKSFFAGSKEIKKADGKPKPPTDFAGAIAAQDVSDNLDNARWTLRTVMYNILADDAITDKKVQIGVQIDAFKTYVLEQLDKVGIKKCAEQLMAEPIEKAGKKISTARLDSIKGAITALQSIVNDVEASNASEEGGTETVEKEEITQIIKSAVGEGLKPINERLGKLEKEEATSCPSCKGTVNPGDKFCSACGTTLNTTATTTKKEDESNEISDIIKSAIQESLNPVNERLLAVEKARGISKQDDEEISINKSGSVFKGIDI